MKFDSGAELFLLKIHPAEITPSNLIVLHCTAGSKYQTPHAHQERNQVRTQIPREDEVALFRCDERLSSLINADKPGV